MYMKDIDKYNNIANDNLHDDGVLQWKLHHSRMQPNEYTKSAWMQRGRFRFDIDYHSKGKFFYIFCRYDNNNGSFNNTPNRTVTLNQIKVEGNSNDIIYKAIAEWKQNFIEQMELI